MNKVLYVTNLPAPYKVSFFNILSKKVELTVVYERYKASDRNQKWKSCEKVNFKELYLKGINIGSESSISFNIIDILKKNKYDLVIINGYSSPTFIFAITYMILHKMKYTLMVDGMLPTHNSFVKKKLKDFLIKNASYYLSSGKITDDQLLLYGANHKNIYRYKFGSISKRFLIDSDYDKSIYKYKIGCKSKKMFLFVGQFIERKGIDLLFESIKDIHEDFSLFMVGGTKEQASIFKYYDDNRIVYCGFKTAEELEMYYKAADVFVLPTREDIWGLVINEAMVYGLPIITTNKCGAGLEMVKKETGWIIDNCNKEDLIKVLKNSLNNNLKKEDIIEIAKNYTIEEMAKSTYKFIDRVTYKNE